MDRGLRGSRNNWKDAVGLLCVGLFFLLFQILR